MQLSKSQMRWAIAFVVVTLVMTGGLWWPAQMRISKLKTQIVSAEEELGIVRGRTDGLAQLALEVEKLRIRSSSNNKQIIQQSELSDLLREFSLQIEAAEMTGQGISTGQTEVEEEWVALPVDMTFEGNSVNVFALIQQIESLPWMLRIEGMKIDRHKDHPDQVDASVYLTTYFRPEEGESS